MLAVRLERNSRVQESRIKLGGMRAAVTANGGSVLVGTTDLGDTGTFALIRDTEGNRVGLHAIS